MPIAVLPWDEACVVMNAADNVGIARRAVTVGTRVAIDGRTVTVDTDIPVGHKMARVDIAAGAPIVRWGAPVGSATAPIAAGQLVHLHNMRSDYIPTFLAGELTRAEAERE